MKLSEIINHVNVVTDEDLPPNEIEGFVNDALARINVECSANFPFLSLETDEEPAFPEKWQRTLLVPYASARVKQKDSSQFEYIDLYGQFESSLSDFQTFYTIPDEYKDAENNKSYDANFDGNYWGGDW